MFDTVLLIITLSFFEIILSLDNAVALSSITEELEIQHQNVVLNLGILFSYLFRIGLIFCATWIVRYWQLKLIAALYLFYLVGDYLYDFAPEDSKSKKHTLLSAIIAVVFTDLAFSLDSISAAVGMSDRFIVIIAGSAIGVLALRFLTELFQKWMHTFLYLEVSGYLAIFFVAIKLLLEIMMPNLAISELTEIIIVAGIFIFGFSNKKTEKIS